jgi:hypothetical protein
MNAAQSVTATFNAAPLTLTVARHPNAPADATRNKGEGNVPMLAFSINPSQATQLQSITLRARGSGDDRLDLTAIKLIHDTNANGRIDAHESPIATGIFGVDNGDLTLSLWTPLALNPGDSQFIVAADIASELAASPSVSQAQSLPALPLPLLLGLLPMLLVGAWRLRPRYSLRLGLLVLTLALMLTACPEFEPPPTLKTYRIDLIAVSAQGSPSVNGLPIAGATITVQK